MKNYKIAICDDSEIFRRQLVDIIDSFSLPADCKYIIEQFSNGEKLLLSSLDFDVVFLNINMPGIDGIETAKLLHEIQSTLPIVFASRATYRFKDAFKVQAFRFVTKPFDSSDVYEALTSVLNIAPTKKTLSVKNGRSSFDISQSDILYLSSYGNEVHVHCSTDTYSCTTSLKKIEDKLNAYFIRVNRSTIINVCFIADYSSTSVTLSDGSYHLVSRRRQYCIPEALA